MRPVWRSGIGLAGNSGATSSLCPSSRATTRTRESIPMIGLLVIDKPPGMTSRDVVNRVQRWFPRKTKIGHTGTLDPLATGVLVVCVGAATRLADYVQAMGKSYASQFRLGANSTTDDAD